MKRACYEWCAILSGMAAPLLLALWILSLFSSSTDLALEFVLGAPNERRYPRLAVTDGSLVWCSDYAIDYVLDHPTSFFGGPATKRRYGLPGLSYTVLSDLSGEGTTTTVDCLGVGYRSARVFDTGAGGWEALYDVRVSLLALTAATGLLAALCAWRLQRLTRAAQVRAADTSATSASTDATAERGQAGAEKN